jgi:hypothetical protein
VISIAYQKKAALHLGCPLIFCKKVYKEKESW